MILTLALTLSLAAPFEDTQKRFTLELPPGWEFAPMPGDTTGATFRKRADKALALASVQILPILPNMDLEKLTKQLIAAVEGEATYSQSAQELTFLAGMSAVRRRFTPGVKVTKPPLVRNIEHRFSIVGDKAYIMQVESLQDTFDRFKTDFDALFASFKPGKKS